MKIERYSEICTEETKEKIVSDPARWGPSDEHKIRLTGKTFGSVEVMFAGSSQWKRVCDDDACAGDAPVIARPSPSTKPAPRRRRLGWDVRKMVRHERSVLKL